MAGSAGVAPSRDGTCAREPNGYGGARIANAYPFHPALGDTLDRRIGTIPKFQRTRGALRLLSRVLAHHWQSGCEAVILNVADLPLDADPVLRDLAIRIDRTNFQLLLAPDRRWCYRY